MREKLKLYIDFLFAGAPNTRAVADTKAEILQNTLDKYDDLVAQGKSPEAAYSLAVSGIGDLGEILTGDSPPVQPNPARRSWLSGLMLAVAVMLYILCVIPVILFDDRGGSVDAHLHCRCHRAADFPVLLLGQTTGPPRGRRIGSPQRRPAEKYSRPAFRPDPGGVSGGELSHPGLVHYLGDFSHFRSLRRHH